MQESHQLPRHSNGLTQRETEVLQLIAEGCSTKELAHKLGICIRTAACHRNSLMHKLNIHDVVTLTRYAIRNGIVQALLIVVYLHDFESLAFG